METKKKRLVIGGGDRSLSVRREDWGKVECWKVRCLDIETGECIGAIFYGPNAEGYAREYAAWMDAREEMLPFVSKTTRSRRCSRPSSPPPPP